MIFLKYLSVFLSAFLLSLLSVGVLKKISQKFGILKPKGVPLVGGMGIGLSFIFVSLLPFVFLGKLSRELVGIAVCSALMLVFGVFDDRRELSVKAKLLFQVLVTGLLILFGVKTQIIYIGNILNTFITFIWIAGITNAFNHLDVTDGLAAGVAIIVSSAFFTISLLNNDVSMMVMNLALIGAVSGFLLFNLPPAKVYLGNSGSHFLGFGLAAIALAISYAPLERKIALLSPLVILGLPILDTLFLILMRISRKKLPFKKSNDHIALRLLKSGHSKRRALLFMLLLCLFFSACGILISQISNALGFLTLALMILVSLRITYRMSKVKVND